MNNEPVLITSEYLRKHKTFKGGYTKAQIVALGLEWPLESGWKDELIGSVLTAEQANNFESGKNKKVSKDKNIKNKNKLTPESAIKYLFQNVNKLTHNDIIRLRNVESKFLDLRKAK